MYNQELDVAIGVALSNNAEKIEVYSTEYMGKEKYILSVTGTNDIVMDIDLDVKDIIKNLYVKVVNEKELVNDGTLKLEEVFNCGEVH